MNSTNINFPDENSKTGSYKSSKKSAKSRSKSSKSATSSTNASTPLVSTSSSTIATATLTTPTALNSGNVFESASNTCSSGSGAINIDSNSSSRNHSKTYAGIEPRSIKIIWEQHDQSDLELSAEVCARVAEDASYKLWELINNVKTYARHSGGTVTYDLVNEVLRDADVPPALGAMDSEWDRIDYDGSYFFYSDKIVELRNEYQKDVTISMCDGADIVCSWPMEDKNTELLKNYIPSLINICLYGDAQSLRKTLEEAAFSPIIGSCYRVLLAKLIQILALKQTDAISLRCWRLLRACASNSHTRDVDCRKEYFHLAEILTCQLIAPYESIKIHSTNTEQEQQQVQDQTIKMEIDEVKLEQEMDMKAEYDAEQQEAFNTPSAPVQEEKIYKLQLEGDDDDDDAEAHIEEKLLETSPYFASPVDTKCVQELCETIGQVSANSGYFQSECIFNITRRLERFFAGRNVSTERDYKYISRAVRGLIALGEYAFREFIPFVYKFNIDEVHDNFRTDFNLAAVYLKGPDDIFLYEWLEYLCGADRLQPFMIYYAQYFEKLITMRFLQRKVCTFKINPKLGVRRLEWSTLAAAMCHGDDPNKALKPKPTLTEVFPDLIAPNLHLNRAGTIRFKFAGCRPVIIKPKTAAVQTKLKSDATTGVGSSGQNEILIARRKLFKPLTNERRIVPLSSYNYLRI